MRNIINFIVTFAVLMLTSTYFPGSVYIDGIGTALLVTLLMFVLDLLYLGILLIAQVPRFLGDAGDTIGTILTVVLALICTPVKLYLLSTFMPGFEILDGWVTYLILTVILSLFSVKGKD